MRKAAGPAILCAVALAGCGARPEERIVDHYRRGTELFNVRRLDEAAAEFMRALELLSELPEGDDRIRAGNFEMTRAQVVGHLGTVRAEQGDHARAVDDLTRALQKAGDNDIDRSERRMWLWTRSRAHESQGKLAEAIMDLEEAVGLTTDPRLETQRRQWEERLEELRKR